jgi:protein-disulfide isomerase
MEKSNLFALGAVVLVAGFLIGRWDGKSRAPAAAADPAAAVATALPEGAPAPAPTPEPTREAAAPSAAPSPSPAAPSAPSFLDSQSDEGAGKGVDVSKIGFSPKDKSPFMGTPQPLVIVNVFSDFQCPVCKRSADPIKQLAADFPGKVKVYFRNNALAMHGRAKPAALAAKAAGNQGKFWQFHDKMFANQQALDDGTLRQHAQELGLDMARWEKDIADPALAARLDQESKWSESMGATGTPAFFVNGSRQVGWGSYLALKSTVQREIEKGEELLAQGTSRDKVPAARIMALAAKNQLGEGESPIDAATWVKNLTAE